MSQDAPIIERRESDLDKAEMKPPPPPPKRARVARQKISAPTKGCVPVSLGGRGLPTSILSRREYGMRVLRR
jgi:hypothetical protein